MITTFYEEMKGCVHHLPQQVKGNNNIRLCFNLFQPTVKTRDRYVVFLNNMGKTKSKIIL